VSKIFVYALIDPRNNEIKYIGATKEGHDRYKRHIRLYYLKKSTLKNNWVKSLLKQNLLPEFVVIEECTEQTLGETEEFYITYFRFLGFKLLNHMNGGYGIKPHQISNEEKKRKASLAQTKYKIIDLETKQIFECPYDLSKAYPEINKNTLFSGIRKPDLTISIKGKFFAQLIPGLDIEKELHERKNRKIPKPKLWRRKAVFEETTKRFFSTIAEAAKELCVDPGDLSKALRNLKKQPKGFRFCYV
jgi:hypothetical protein